MNEQTTAACLCLQGIVELGRKNMSLARFSVYCEGDGVAQPGWTRLGLLKVDGVPVVLDFLRVTLPEYGKTLQPVGRPVRQARWQPPPR